MLQLTCPFCGPRDEREFTYGGPLTERRPDNADNLEPEAWVERLTVPDNPLGVVREWWWHERGCGEWVLVERDTRSHALAGGNGGSP